MKLWWTAMLIPLLGTALVSVRLSPFHPIQCTLLGQDCPPWHLGGNVEAGFESIERLFREKLERGIEWGAQLVVYRINRPSFSSPTHL